MKLAHKLLVAYILLLNIIVALGDDEAEEEAGEPEAAASEEAAEGEKEEQADEVGVTEPASLEARAESEESEDSDSSGTVCEEEDSDEEMPGFRGASDSSGAVQLTIEHSKLSILLFAQLAAISYFVR